MHVGTVSSTIDAQIRTEQIRLLFDQGAAAFLINGLVALALATLIGPHVPLASLMAWCLFFAVAWALRGIVYVLHRVKPEALSEDAWLRLFSVGVLVSGATWGMTALWLFPTAVTDRFLVAVGIMGLASGAAASLSCVRSVYPLYLFPAFLPVAIRFAFDSGSNPRVIVALAILYCFGMAYAANLNYQQLTTSLRLRFENIELAMRLETLATHDPLTGLANRRLFLDRLDLALRRSRRSKEKAAVIYMDCDDFKQINDLYGHSAGDEFLRQIANALVQSVREVDTVARFGGDEFVILLENVADRRSLDYVVQRMHARALQSMGIGDATVAPTLKRRRRLFPRGWKRWRRVAPHRGSSDVSGQTRRRQSHLFLGRCSAVINCRTSLFLKRHCKPIRRACRAGALHGVLRTLRYNNLVAQVFTHN